MPFDGAGFPPERGRRERPAPGDNMVSFIIIFLAFGLLVMPISVTALVDVIHYLRSS